MEKVQKILKFKIALFVLPIFMVLTNSTMAKFREERDQHCLTSEELQIIKIRIVKDNLSLAIRKCDFPKTTKGELRKLEYFFSKNDEELISLHKKMYDEFYKKNLDKFITENSNQASIKYSYDKEYFCDSYQSVLKGEKPESVIKKTEKFKIPQPDYCI